MGLDYLDMLDMMEQGYGQSRGMSSSNTSTIVITIISILAALVIYFIFVVDDREKYKGFLGFLHKFANFNVLILEELLRISYIVVFVYIILKSITLLLTGHVAQSLVLLIFTSIGVRILYEVLLTFLIISRNIREINEKTPGKPRDDGSNRNQNALKIRDKMKSAVDAVSKSVTEKTEETVVTSDPSVEPTTDGENNE